MMGRPDTCIYSVFGFAFHVRTRAKICYVFVAPIVTPTFRGHCCLAFIFVVLDPKSGTQEGYPRIGRKPAGSKQEKTHGILSFGAPRYHHRRSTRLDQ